MTPSRRSGPTVSSAVSSSSTSFLLLLLLLLLLCNREDLVSIWVFKPRDCSSPKSMWFLWNIVSKGTHMLQCLCGKSLKKNKNPSGKPPSHPPTPPHTPPPPATTIAHTPPVLLRACECETECVRRAVLLRLFVCLFFVVMVTDLRIASMQQVDHAEVVVVGGNLFSAATISCVFFLGGGVSE